MRILLDEDLPMRLGLLLKGHESVTVQQAGWSGIKNGKLLALAGTKFDVLLTMDGGLEFQQNLSTLPVAVLIVEALSNRMEHLEPLVPEILKELDHVQPRTLCRVRKERDQGSRSCTGARRPHGPSSMRYRSPGLWP